MIENLFSRAGGVNATYNAVNAGNATTASQIQAVQQSTALAAYQGRPNALVDPFVTEFDYLRFIYQHLYGQRWGITRPVFRTVIIPGDNTQWLVWTDPLDGNLFVIPGSGRLKGPQVPSSGNNPPFFVPRPYFDCGPRSGNVMSAQNFIWGHIKEHLPIIQVNVTFQLPSVANVAGMPSDLGFGLVDRPIGTSGCVGVWVQPTLTSGQWLSPWPCTVSIATGSGSPVVHTIASLGVPSGDNAPGGITIAINRARVGIYLYRGWAGQVHTVGTIPTWWVYPWAPWLWPFSWPCAEQTLIAEWGNPTYYPGITSHVMPPVAPLKIARSWPGMLLSEIDVEEVPLYALDNGINVTAPISSTPNPPAPPITSGPYVWVLYRGNNNEPEPVPFDYLSLGTDPGLLHFVIPTITGYNGQPWTPLTTRVGGSTNPYSTTDYNTYSLTVGAPPWAGGVNPYNLVIESGAF